MGSRVVLDLREMHHQQIKGIAGLVGAKNSVSRDERIFMYHSKPGISYKIVSTILYSGAHYTQNTHVKWTGRPINI